MRAERGRKAASVPAGAERAVDERLTGSRREQVTGTFFHLITPEERAS